MTTFDVGRRFVFRLTPRQAYLLQAFDAVGLHPDRGPGWDPQVRTIDTVGSPSRRIVEQILATGEVRDVACLPLLTRGRA